MSLGSERSARVLPVLVPTIVTALVGGISLARSSIWTDEAATWSTARMRVSSIFDFTLHTRDAVFLPYYLFMHVWLGASQQLWWVRLPSLVAAVATTWALTSLARRWLEPTWTFLAGILLAVNPLFVRWAMEARPYALATLFAVLSTRSLLTAVERGGRWRWLAYGTSSALMLLFHLLAILVLLAHAATTLVCKRTSAWLGQAITLACVVGLLGPLAVVAAGQRAQVSWIPRPTLGTFFTALADVSGGHTPALGLIVCSLVLLVAGLRARAGSRQRFLAALTLTWALGPPVALVAASYLHPVYVDRYALVSVPGVAAVEAMAAHYAWHALRQTSGAVAARLSVSGKHPAEQAREAMAARSSWPGAGRAALGILIVAAPVWLARTSWGVARETYYYDDYRSATTVFERDLGRSDPDILIVKAESGQGFAFYAHSTRLRDELLHPSRLSSSGDVNGSASGVAALWSPGIIWSRGATARVSCANVIAIGWHRMPGLRFDVGRTTCRLRDIRSFGLVWVGHSESV